MIRTLTIDQQYLGESLADCNVEQAYKESVGDTKNVASSEFEDESKQIQFREVEDDQVLEIQNQQSS